MLEVGLNHHLVVGAILFACGLFVMATKRNAVGILIGVELVLNAAGLNFVAFNRYHAGLAGGGAGTGMTQVGGPVLDGQIATLFVIVLAAAEAAVAIAIFVNYYRRLATIDVDEGDVLRG
ncbi:MAG: NADH-quinone oxidoreductase subunit NuoK [Planctomycetota bacterium]